MKSIIIPDIHGQFKIVDKLLDHQSGRYHDIIFLGDHFDSFGDSPDIVRETATWLNKMLDRDDVINLNSNHDISYMYPTNKHLYCSGFEHEKARAIFSVLDIFKFREKTKAYHRINNFIFSHAGVSRKLLEYFHRKGLIDSVEYDASQIENQLNSMKEKARVWSEVGHVHPLYDAGYDRGGPAEVGGILWCDFDYFEPIPNVINFFGHTPQTSTVSLKLCKTERNSDLLNKSHSYFPEKESRDIDHLFKNGVGICIDTHMHSFAVYDSDENNIQVFKIVFDKKLKEAYYDRNIVDVIKVWERTFPKS
jgi:hypothetical protein